MTRIASPESPTEAELRKETAFFLKEAEKREDKDAQRELYEIVMRKDSLQWRAVLRLVPDEERETLRRLRRRAWSVLYRERHRQNERDRHRAYYRRRLEAMSYDEREAYRGRERERKRRQRAKS